MESRKVISPLLIMVFCAIAFELLVRLPYVRAIAEKPEVGRFMQVHFFASYNAFTVINLGIALVICVLLATCMAALVTRPVYQMPHPAPALPRIPSSVYVLGIIMILATLGAIGLVGGQALVEAFSSKRSELGERGLLWILLKVAVFSHLVACIFYIRAHQTRKLIDKLFFWALVICLFLVTMVFSQRAILISFILEIMFLQLLLGTFRLRRILAFLGLIFAVIITISALRPGLEVHQNFLSGFIYGVERMVISRYFFDFSKLGAVMLWADDASWLGPVSIGFLLEPFFGDQVVFYKEIGPMIASEVYLYRHQHGVTPGAYLEALLSFGIFGGVAFYFMAIVVFLRLEALVLRRRFQSTFQLLLLLIIISKLSLFLNSSMGAFAFQATIEVVMLVASIPLLMPFASRVRWRRRNIPQDVLRPARSGPYAETGPFPAE